MRITETKIKLVCNPNDKLLAFASVTFDECFVVRDIKIIQGSRGLFVAMPSRKITDRCPNCSTKNHLHARFCNQCGKRLFDNRARLDTRGRNKLHADIAHPINSQYRHELQQAILNAFDRELEASKLPGYVPSSFDDFDEGPDDYSQNSNASSEIMDGSLESGIQTTRIAVHPAKSSLDAAPSPALLPEDNKLPNAEKNRSPSAPADGGGFGIFA